ncbi:MAG: phenylalanine--tRNA ligase subunit alpha [Syntrophales bacterium]|nr:phenylalanine--tRNA ligase subunit alpha [Syntrophales bacterium]
MMEELEGLRRSAESDLAAARTEDELTHIKTKYLGRKGALTAILRRIGSLGPEERQQLGKKANELKDFLSQQVEAALVRIRQEDRARKLQKEKIDCTLPGRRVAFGHKHPITIVREEICEIFGRLGFTVVEGPEVETDYYNFTALNIPPDHPARDMQDTFYLDNELLLRTHTSPVQVRTMEQMRPPLRILSPGRVYRPDSDVSHTPMFHQVEGLMVDRGVTFADLKGVLTYFVREMFGPETALRFRPSFFPFTEPSAEVDICCVICRGSGCRVCSQTGWLEILGSGMVDPAVFENVGYDAEEFTGFAFGLGIERIAMLKYGIGDIRLFFENDRRFLAQF